LQRIRRAKLFVLLRQRRHELFDEAFQTELAAAYADRPKGQPPVPPAQLALATILQAYTGASDDEVIEALVMDRRWQLVLDCLASGDTGRAPFAKGTLQAFRARLMATGLDRRLLERTVALAATPAAARQLRAALDSSPLWGAGRVEDTFNLIGHALRKAVGVICRQQGRELTDLPVVAAEAGAPVLGGPSLKAALDCDWDDPDARGQALGVVLAALDAVADLVAGRPAADPAAASVAVAQQVRAQDVIAEPDAAHGPRLRQGVARDRRISVEDAQMRHGRKSRSTLIDGYKRHVLRDLDTGLVRAVGITPANIPEAAVAAQITDDLAAQDAELVELHIDRAYLASGLVRDRAEDLAIYCKAWRVRNGPRSAPRFAKTAFALDFDRGELTCPNQVVVPFTLGGTVRFPAEVCAGCPLRVRCTTSSSGRSVSIHPDERLLVELRQRQLSAAGRAKLRERVAVEHSLAHIGRWQGRRARYLGVRKNLFDLRRVAVVHNLHVLARQLEHQAA